MKTKFRVGMAAVLMVVAAAGFLVGQALGEGTQSYDDVAPDGGELHLATEWAAQAKVMGAKVVDGEEAFFRPQDPLTRGQMVKILHRYSEWEDRRQNPDSGHPPPLQATTTTTAPPVVTIAPRPPATTPAATTTTTTAPSATTTTAPVRVWELHRLGARARFIPSRGVEFVWPSGIELIARLELRCHHNTHGTLSVETEYETSSSGRLYWDHLVWDHPTAECGESPELAADPDYHYMEYHVVIWMNGQEGRLSPNQPNWWG